jgi:hypothetical protein
LHADDNGTRQSTYIYFGLSVLVIVAGIFLFIFALESSPVTHYYLRKAESEQAAAAASADASVDAAEIKTVSGGGLSGEAKYASVNSSEGSDDEFHSAGGVTPVNEVVVHSDMTSQPYVCKPMLSL